MIRFEMRRSVCHFLCAVDQARYRLRRSDDSGVRLPDRQLRTDKDLVLLACAQSALGDGIASGIFALFPAERTGDDNALVRGVKRPGQLGVRLAVGLADRVRRDGKNFSVRLGLPVLFLFWLRFPVRFFFRLNALIFPSSGIIRSGVQLPV